MNKTYPKISIVTPSLNQGRFIEDAILSVMEQNYPNFEHIVIDGGSMDETLKILKKYPHLIWVSELDRGQSDALNKGFKMATGDIIGWLNTDDYYLEGCFDAVAEYLLRNPHVDFLYGEYQYVDVEKRFLRQVRNTKYDKKMLFFLGCYIPSTASFFRKRIIEEGNFLDPEYKVVMDKEYLIRLSVRGYQFAFLQRVLASFRVRDDNVGKKYQYRWPKENEKIWKKYKSHFMPIDLPYISHHLLSWSYKAKRLYYKVIS